MIISSKTPVYILDMFCAKKHVTEFNKVDKSATSGVYQSKSLVKKCSLHFFALNLKQTASFAQKLNF